MQRLTLTLLALVAVAVAAPPAGAAEELVAQDAAQLDAALVELAETGGTVVLASRHHPRVVVRAQPRRWLTIVAARGATVGRVLVENARRVRLVRLHVTPRGGHARLEVRGSSSIVFNGLRLTGRGVLRANAAVRNSGDVSFTGGEFTRCGEGRTPEAGYCLLLRETSGVAITGNDFHDCFGCDFVHGVLNWNLTIRANAFHRARVGACGISIERCHHQDIIHLMRGGNVVVDRNILGVNQWPGAAQVYANGDMRGLTVTNNLFLATDPQLPGVRAKTAMWIGNRRDREPPRNVFIAHNTILSGAKRTLRGEQQPLLSSIFFPHAYAGLPLAERPVVANNVIQLLRTPHRMCPFARILSGNVIVKGERCGEANVVGHPRLDRAGRPTAASTLLIGRADDAFALPIDLFARGRSDPDVGAFEYQP